ncbi:hypothetical protein I5E72_10120 [Proteus terrae]|uniref:hypothetical protein n=1 Tax=Proteus terrae TaxID=1574161 RepID=UPI0018C74BA0|nr:hypothetical protein [Proteus terrae]MBG5950098.1 hypothetical protein [Proteus terrae]
MNTVWPLWAANLGLLATFLGVFITLVILCQTRSLSKAFNKKAGSGYIVSSIANIYKVFSDEIITASQKKFEENTPDIKYRFWKLIQECNGCVAVCKQEESDENIYVHVELFKLEVKKIANAIESKDKLTYETTWSYYHNLTKLHEAIKNQHDMNSRKV